MKNKRILITGRTGLLGTARNDSKLIYISSNAIYDGENAPYGEDDEANPQLFFYLVS